MAELVMYVFGDRNPELTALLQEERFQGLVHELFAAQEIMAPSEPPPVWEEALRLEVLASGLNGYRSGRRLVLIPAAAERGAADLLRDLSSYVEIAAETGAELRATYGQTAVAERFSWPQVSHLILAGLFLDLAMGAEVVRSGRISREPTGDSVVWAFQGISAENAYGVGSVPAAPPRRAFFADLWHRKSRQGALRLSPAHVESLIRIGQGEQARDPKELLYFRHLKLIRSDGGGLQLQIPAFGASDAQRLLTPLTEGARRLVNDAIAPALERLKEDHPWWREHIDQEAYRHAAVRLILEHGIDHVIAAGACEPFPEARDTPFEWGRCLWEEPGGAEETVMPHLISRKGGASA